MKCHSLPPKYLLSAPRQTLSQCWISGPFHATNASSLRCSVVILRPYMLWHTTLLPIDSTIDSMAPLTHAVTMHCNRSGILSSWSYKAGSEQNVLMIFKFSGQLVNTAYARIGLTCFKNEVSDISCFMSIMYGIQLQTRNFFLPMPLLQRLPLLALVFIKVILHC